MYRTKTGSKLHYIKDHGFRTHNTNEYKCCYICLSKEKACKNNNLLSDKKAIYDNYSTNSRRSIGICRQLFRRFGGFFLPKRRLRFYKSWQLPICVMFCCVLFSEFLRFLLSKSSVLRFYNYRRFADLCSDLKAILHSFLYT